MCAVYALFGVVLIPISFLAIRISRSIIHPEVFTRHGPQMTHAQFLTFCVCWLAMLVPVRDALPDRARRQAARHPAARAAGAARMTPVREVHGRRVPRRLRRRARLRPDHRLEAAAAPAPGRRARRAGARARPRAPPRARVAELLFWPALLGYGEAAIAYTLAALHAARDLGRAHRLARRRRRCSCVQAARVDALPVVDAGPARSTSSSGSSSAPT